MLKNKLLNWAIILFGIILIFNLSRSIIQLSQKGSAVGKAEERVRKAEEENARLRERYREVRRPEYIEKIAREKLGLGKEGEVVVVLPDDNKSQISRLPGRQANLKSQTEHDSKKEEKPIWKQWVELFF